MGSIQQITMGGTCLAAAFFFGQYLNNREITQQQPLGENAIRTPGLVGLTDPIAAAKPPQIEPPVLNTAPSLFDAAHRPVTAGQSTAASRLLTQANPLPTAPETERPAAPLTKPVAPDFSMLARQFEMSAKSAPQLLESSVRTLPQHVNELAARKALPPAPAIRQRPPVASPLKDFASRVDAFESGAPKFAANAEAANEPIPFAPAETSTPEPPTHSNSPNAIANQWRVRTPQVVPDGTTQFYESDRVAPPVPANPTPKFVSSPNQKFIPDHSTDSLLDQRMLAESEARAIRDAGEMPQPDEYYVNAESLETSASRSGDRWSSINDDSRYVPRQDDDRVRSYYRVELDERLPEPNPRFVAPPEPAVNGAAKSVLQNNDSANPTAERIYRTRRGDTLQSISTKFYGEPDRYLDLFIANQNRLPNPAQVPAGVELTIPSLQ